jgi:hypothetical protein
MVKGRRAIVQRTFGAVAQHDADSVEQCGRLVLVHRCRSGQSACHGFERSVVGRRRGGYRTVRKLSHEDVRSGC